MSDSSKESEQNIDRIQNYSDEFDALSLLRHEIGAEEYGDVAFLKAPLVRMAAEELADFSNYVRYMYIKLRLLEDFLDASGIDLSAGTPKEVWSEDEVPSGFTAFMQREEVQGFLSKAKQGR